MRKIEPSRHRFRPGETGHVGPGAALTIRGQHMEVLAVRRHRGQRTLVVRLANGSLRKAADEAFIPERPS